MTDLTSTVRDTPVDDSPPPRSPVTRRASAAWMLWLLGGTAAAILLHAVVLSPLEQGHAQSRLYGQLRSQLAEGTAPTGAPIAAGAPVALIDAPSIGLHSVAVEGTSAVSLQHGPGHFTGTVLPGQQGVSVLAGRAVTYGAVFSRITSLRPGAQVKVTTGQGRFTYAVARVRQPGDPVPAAPAAGKARLTLVTAATRPGPLPQVSHTVYVDCDLVGKPVAAGAVGAVDPAGGLLSMHASTADLAVFALSLQLLIATIVCFILCWHRWSRRHTWIAVTPAVIAAAWLAASIGGRFWPNLL